MTNGNKTSKQLDAEVNDILAARQKRDAARAVTRDQEYERREFNEAGQKLREVEKAPLAERKEAAAEFLAAMRDNPQLIGERIGWLLGGSYCGV